MSLDDRDYYRKALDRAEDKPSALRPFLARHPTIKFRKHVPAWIIILAWIVLAALVYVAVKHFTHR